MFYLIKFFLYISLNTNVTSKETEPLKRLLGGFGNGEAFLTALSAALSKSLFLELFTTLKSDIYPSGLIIKLIVVFPSISLFFPEN